MAGFLGGGNIIETAKPVPQLFDNNSSNTGTYHDNVYVALYSHTGSGMITRALVYNGWLSTDMIAYLKITLDNQVVYWVQSYKTGTSPALQTWSGFVTIDQVSQSNGDANQLLMTQGDGTLYAITRSATMTDTAQSNVASPAKYIYIGTQPLFYNSNCKIEMTTNKAYSGGTTWGSLGYDIRAYKV